MKYLAMILALTAFAVSPVFANEKTTDAPVPMTDVQLDQVSAGFLDFNIAPVIVVQIPVAVTTQIGIGLEVYQGALTAAGADSDITSINRIFGGGL
jgi:hypothetical protein